jgi:hypothetical protein
MSLRRTAAIVLRQYYLLRGSPTRILPLFVWVSVDIILWGFITRYLNSVASSGIDFVPALLGAVLLWDFFIRVMQGVTTAFFEDVWSRSLLNVFASPIKIPEYLGGLVISSVVTSAAGLVVMQILASTIFGLSFFKYGAALMPFLAGVVFVRHRAGSVRQRGGAALRTGIGVADLAHSGAAVTIRRGVLSAFSTPRMDAIRCAAAAAFLCVRGRACDRRRSSSAWSWVDYGRRAGGLRCSGCGRLLHAHLKTSRPHRPDCPIQRRKPQLSEPT